MGRPKHSVDESLYHVIRTLYSLGHSRRMISTVLNINKNILYREFEDIVGDVTIGKKLKLKQYKNASLVAIALATDQEKNKIQALNSLDTTIDDDDLAEKPVADTTRTDAELRLDIIRDLT